MELTNVDTKMQNLNNVSKELKACLNKLVEETNLFDSSNYTDELINLTELLKKSTISTIKIIDKLLNIPDAKTTHCPQTIQTDSNHFLSEDTTNIKSTDYSNDPCILLVEDDIVTVKLIKSILMKKRCLVIEATNGAEAIIFLKYCNPSLVFMDLQMPVMDGIAATKAIRNNEIGTNNRVPIVALTAHSHEIAYQKSIDAGMDGFITKPIQAYEVYKIIEELAKVKLLKVK